MKYYLECIYCGYFWISKWKMFVCIRCKDKHLRTKEYKEVDYYGDANSDLEIEYVMEGGD